LIGLQRLVVLEQLIGLPSQRVPQLVDGEQMLPRLAGIRENGKSSCCLGCHGSMLYIFCRPMQI
jgi:hypothetical protein